MGLVLRIVCLVNEYRIYSTMPWDNKENKQCLVSQGLNVIAHFFFFFLNVSARSALIKFTLIDGMEFLDGTTAAWVICKAIV